MILIDADLAIEKCNEDLDAVKDLPQRQDGILDAIMNIHECPTIDAVPVVRCRDCKHKVTTEDGEYNPRDIVCDYWESDGLEETDFCSYGERRTDE